MKLIQKTTFALLFVFITSFSSVYAATVSPELLSPVLVPPTKATVTSAPTLTLTYDSAHKESKLTGTGVFSVIAGSQQDVYVVGAPFSFNLNGGNTQAPNRTTFTLVGTSGATLQSDKSWKIPKGKTATFKETVVTYPSDMLAGVYTISFKNILLQNSAVLPVVNLLVSNSVAIVGETTSVDAPIINTLDKGTLKLTYDSKKRESLLSGTQKISVTAGSSDIFIKDLTLGFIKDGVQVNYIDGTKYDFTGVQNTKKETVILVVSQGSGQSSVWIPNVPAWRVKAGQTATFNVSISTNPQNMYAGTYRVRLVNDSFLFRVFDVATSSPFSGIDSDPVAIVGESHK